jgi:exodeoxyribonuclease VII small subunit
MEKSITYTEAFNELQEIVSEIENGDISVDDLAEKVKRAAFLIQICKAKLKATEADVKKILQELESSENVEDNPPDQADFDIEI